MFNKLRSWVFVFVVGMLTLLAVHLPVPDGWSAASEASFYQGKILRLIPYASPGSGTDVMARIIAPFLGKHIPGHPSVIVQNLPGGGGVIAANYMFNLAKPDGLRIGILSRGMPILSLAKPPGTKYDASKFRWVGSPAKGISVCIARSDSGFKSIRDVIGSKKPLILGASGRGAGSFVVPSTLNATLGTNIKIITGYRGAPAMHLAMEQGEIHGRCLFYRGKMFDPFLVDGLKSGYLKYMVQLPTRHPTVPPEVPVANELISKPADLALLNLMSFPFFSWVVPPAISEERLTVLRDGFMKTFQDPKFRTTANKAGVVINEIPGEKAEKIALKLMDVPEETKRKMKEILGY